MLDQGAKPRRASNSVRCSRAMLRGEALYFLQRAAAVPTATPIWPPVFITRGLPKPTWEALRQRPAIMRFLNVGGIEATEGNPVGINAGELGVGEEILGGGLGIMEIDVTAFGGDGIGETGMVAHISLGEDVICR